MYKHKPKHSPQVDELFACLADHHRRLIIRSLSEEDTPITLEGLTQRIAQYEYGSPTTEEDPPQITVTLYHQHIPKLAEADLVDVDHEFNTIREGDRFETAAALLAEVAEDRR